MRYLKTTFESDEYNALQGYTKDNNTIELMEDANGDYYTTEANKENHCFIEVLDHLNNMDVVDEIEDIELEEIK